MHHLILLLCLTFSTLFAEWEKPLSLSNEDWITIKPYLLPHDHSLRKKLDKIFSNGNILQNQKTLKKNHFSFPYWRGEKKIVVAKHPKIKNYVFKVFLDSQDIKCEWEHFIHRIKGSQLIAQTIEERKKQHEFKVPQKWLYMLPKKNKFILVTQDMQILIGDENRKKWRSSHIKDTTIIGLYSLIHDLGLFDSTYLDNIPFCQDGKIAFVDTEHYDGHNINYKRLDKVLHPEKRKIWRALWKRDHS